MAPAPSSQTWHILACSRYAIDNFAFLMNHWHLQPRIRVLEGEYAASRSPYAGRSRRCFSGPPSAATRQCLAVCVIAKLSDSVQFHLQLLGSSLLWDGCMGRPISRSEERRVG